MKWVCVVCSSVALIAGCQQDSPQRLNSPPQGQSANRSCLQPPFEAMVRNASLEDMSVTDSDFAGTSTELNGTGRVRMHRMAELLKKYGGELHYAAEVDDQKLIQSRINRLEDYLASAGLDMNKVSVRPGMPASDHMTAAEAIRAQKAPTTPANAGSSRAGLRSLAPGGLANGNGGDATK
jgi:hypothetical protein